MAQDVTIKSGSMSGGTFGGLSHEWATRPPDERIVGANSAEARQNLYKIANEHYMNSKAIVVNTHAIQILPVDGDAGGLVMKGPSGGTAAPSYWAMTQLCQRAGVPAGYLRDGLSGNATLAAQCLNYGLQTREDDRVGLMLTKRPSTGSVQMTAATGPTYGRIWNKDVIQAVNAHLDDKWTVPGIFGKAVTTITQENTSLFLSAQDMYIFLADETRRIEVPNRRNGKAGSLARGILIGNSEVGAAKLKIMAMLFDYACSNRNIWGVEDFVEINIRHSSGAPSRFLNEARPAIRKFLDAKTDRVTEVLRLAQNTKIPDALSFLGRKFTRPASAAIVEIHKREEGRPIETVWDANVGATAYAREQPYQDERLRIEMLAGELMPKIAA